MENKLRGEQDALVIREEGLTKFIDELYNQGRHWEEVYNRVREAVSTNVSVTAAENTGTSPTTTTVEAQLLSMEAALHTTFAGGGNEYAVNQGRSEQSGENIGGSFQLQKSYETGTELITMN